MMKLQVLQENLSRSLNIASRFASTRAQLPVLSNISLSAKKNKLLVAATNLEMSVSLPVGAKVEKEGGITVPARVVTDLVSNLPPGQVSLESAKEQLKISAQNFKSVVSGMNPSDFPAVPEAVSGKVLKLPKDAFLDALSSVLFAVSIDETRPVLTGVLIIFKEEEIVFVATDGFRLSQAKIKQKSGLKTQKVILPKNALSEFVRLTNEEEEVSFSFNEAESQAIFGLENATLASRVIEGNFPDFEKIIPRESIYQISADKEEVLRAVKLSSVFARDAANVVKMKVKEEAVEFLAQSPTHGSQKTEVDAKIEGGKNLEISFNFRFLEDFLNAVRGEEVQIELSSANAPGVFTNPSDPNFLHLIMPVRTQD